MDSYLWHTSWATEFSQAVFCLQYTSRVPWSNPVDSYLWHTSWTLQLYQADSCLHFYTSWIPWFNTGDSHLWHISWAPQFYQALMLHTSWVGGSTKQNPAYGIIPHEYMVQTNGFLPVAYLMSTAVLPSRFLLTVYLMRTVVQPSGLLLLHTSWDRGSTKQNPASRIIPNEYRGSNQWIINVAYLMRPLFYQAESCLRYNTSWELWFNNGFLPVAYLISTLVLLIGFLLRFNPVDSYLWQTSWDGGSTRRNPAYGIILYLMSTLVQQWILTCCIPHEHSGSTKRNPAYGIITHENYGSTMDSYLLHTSWAQWFY